MTTTRLLGRRLPVQPSALSLMGWTGRSNVQRIDLYTRWSLRLLGWFLLVVGWFSALAIAEGALEGAAVTLLALLLLLVVDRCVMAFMRLWFEPGPLPWGWMAGLVVLVVPTVVWLAVDVPEDDRFGISYLLTSAIAWSLGGARRRWLTWAAVVGGALVCSTSGEWMVLYGAAIAAFFVFTVQSSLWVLGVVHELDRARTAQADLAVAEERLRFSRDVHDVMGRHLSTIAVQAELAATLAERGDARAAERIREVRATAHEALREARTLARGYRPLDLIQELEGARALLASAGIRAEGDLAGLPAGWEELAARLVREAVTNILRHSRATRVCIEHADGVVSVRNDGVEARDSALTGDGSGLRTLAADASARGARLTWGATDGDFVVRLHLTDPEEATS